MPFFEQSNLDCRILVARGAVQEAQLVHPRGSFLPSSPALLGPVVAALAHSGTHLRDALRGLVDWVVLAHAAMMRRPVLRPCARVVAEAAPTLTVVDAMRRRGRRSPIARAAVQPASLLRSHAEPCIAPLSSG